MSELNQENWGENPLREAYRQWEAIKDAEAATLKYLEEFQEMFRKLEREMIESLRIPPNLLESSQSEKSITMPDDTSTVPPPPSEESSNHSTD